MADSKIIIFGDKCLEEYVWHRRDPENKSLCSKIQSFLKKCGLAYCVQIIRSIKLKGSSFASKYHPQFTLQYQNPIIFSKMQLLKQAIQHDKFNSVYLIWSDAGLSHISDFRQGFYGGYIEAVHDVKCTFQIFLRIILYNGDTNSDQSVLAMMPVKYPSLFSTIIVKYTYQLYKNLETHIDFDRKPQHSRLFKADFDSQGNIYFVENRTYAGYLVVLKEFCLLKQVSEGQTVNNQQIYMLFEKSLMALRQVLFREIDCLLFIVSIYIWYQANKNYLQILIGKLLIE